MDKFFARESKRILDVFITLGFYFQYIVGVSIVVSGEIGLGVAFLFFNDALGERLESRVLPHTVPIDYGLNQPFSQSIDFLQHKVKYVKMN